MRRKKSTRITVIIPTLWSGESKMLERAVASILADADTQHQLVVQIVIFLNSATVIDQRSLERRLRTRITTQRDGLSLLSSECNKGFTGAINEALFWARVEKPSDWYIVLNDDAVLKTGFFRAFMTETCKKDVALISCAVEDTKQEIESYGLVYSRTGLAFPRKKIPRAVTTPVVCGTCFGFSSQLVEREIDALGFLLNPMFFAYAEDLELSLRVQLSGKRIVLIPEVFIQHQGSQTAGRASLFQLYHGYRNLLLCIALLWSPLYIVLHLPWIFFGQIYVLVVLLSKGYLLAYPRIVWYLIKRVSVLKTQRSIYAQHYGHLYSAQH